MEETIASVRLLCEYAPFVGRTYALTTFLLLTKIMKVRAVPHPEVFTDNIFGPSRPVNVHSPYEKVAFIEYDTIQPPPPLKNPSHATVPLI